MSEVEKLDPTAGGDAPIIETIKTDVDNTILQSTEHAPEYVDITSENAAAKEIEASMETKNSVDANSKNMLEEIANSSICDAQLKIAGAETVNLITEDVSTIQFDAQTPAAEIDSSITLQSEETSEKSVNEEKEMQNVRGDNAMCVSRLEAELRVRESLEDTDHSERNELFHELDNIVKRTKERDIYRKSLEDTETKLAALQMSYDTIINGSDENTLQQSVEQLHNQLAQTAQMYEERNRVVANQENQINALNNQVASLKEVVSITRDLLQIRNMEVKQLQAEVDNMEKKISEERDRHNDMINKMDTAIRINADLKKEYETQLSLFQSLRQKYGEKITLLTGEKQALDTITSTSE